MSADRFGLFRIIIDFFSQATPGVEGGRIIEVSAWNVHMQVVL